MKNLQRHTREENVGGFLTFSVGFRGATTVMKPLVQTVFFFLVFQGAFLLYRHYLHRNVTSMNFDNPIYRKTTEDQFTLEKSQYQPARVYPASIGEEVNYFNVIV